MGRAPCCEKVGLKRGRWTAEEDETLMKYIQTNGEGSWRSLPKNAGLLRCGKSCRLRWINYLRADLRRGNITPEEEEIIVKLHGSFGNRWSLIAGNLPGRTDNEIKNYWNSHLSRRIHCFKRPNDELPMIMDIGKITGGPKRKGGKTSKSSMKKGPTSVEMMKDEEQDGGAGFSTMSMEATESILVQNEVRESNALGGPHHANGVGMAPSEEIEGDIMGPHQVLMDEIFSCSDESTGSGALVPTEGRENVNVGTFLGRESGSSLDPIDGIEDGFFFPDEVIESGMTGGPNEERENGAMGLQKDGSESGVVMSEASSSMGSSCFDQAGCLQDGWLDWEWDEVWNSMEGGGEIYSSSWLWESDHGREGDCHRMVEWEQEKFTAWLLSADTNVM